MRPEPKNKHRHVHSIELAYAAMLLAHLGYVTYVTGGDEWAALKVFAIWTFLPMALWCLLWVFALVLIARRRARGRRAV